MTSKPPSTSRLHVWLMSVPVFVKVMGIALGMAILLGTGMLWQIHRTWHAHLLNDLEKRGQRLADRESVHCAELARTGTTVGIQAELQHSLNEVPDAVYLILQHTNGPVLAEARASEPANAETIHELAAPIDASPHLLRVGMSTDRVDREVDWLTGRLALTTAIIALLGMAAAWWLTRIFTRPVEELVNFTRAVKAGQYQTKAPVRSGDEVGELAVAFNEMTAAIAQKEAARQHLLRAVIHAGEEERKRIARELHDHTGQALTSQIATLSALETQATDPVCRHRLVELRQQVEQTLTEVHDLSVALRPSVLDDIGLMAALERHCQLFARRSGIEVNCTNEGFNGNRLPADIELTLYRVVQEALTNAVRHGKATRVSAQLRRNQDEVQTAIQDNGVGFDAHEWQRHCASGNHLGLLGIEERVHQFDGSFRVESEPGKGATLHAAIPLKPGP